jgi:hypothetical protein
MHDAFGMGSIDEGLAVEQPAHYAVLQRRAVEKLHGDEGLTLMLPDLVNRADVGMVQTRGRARFAAKALQGAGILGKLRRQKLERHEPAQFHIFGFVDNAHSTTA